MDFIREYFLLILPLVVLEFSLKGFCFWKLFKEGSANLSKGLWTLITGMTHCEIAVEFYEQ